MSKTQIPILVVLLSILSPLGVVENAFGQLPNQVVANTSAYDVVQTKDRVNYIGYYVETEPGGDVLFVVRRKWLSERDKNYAKHAARALQQERFAYEQLRDRTDAILKATPDAPHSFFLQTEWDRADKWLKAESHPESLLMFVWIPQASIARSMQAAPESGKIGRWAWAKELEHPETRDAKALSKELASQKTDVSEESTEIAMRVHALPQSDDEWQARMALVEYSQVENVSFQGSGDVMIRTNHDGNQPDLGPIISKLMQSQAQNFLEDLLGEKSNKNQSNSSKAPWVKAAYANADGLKKAYVLATSVSTDMLNWRAEVSSLFAVKLSGSRWQPIWKLTREQDTQSLPQSAVQTINDDPQIKSLKEKLSQFGLGAATELDQAMRFGGATMLAQRDVDYQFQVFRQRYMERLDIPALRWPSEKP